MTVYGEAPIEDAWVDRVSGIDGIQVDIVRSSRRADPTLFVERRMGLGYTLNLGNPWAWLVMTVFVSAIAVPLWLVP